jgi:WD40 repeat protein
VNRHRRAALVTLCLVGLAGCSGAVSVSPPTGGISPRAGSSANTFLAVESGVHEKLELRWYGDGELVKTLQTTDDALAATRAADGSILTTLSSTSHGCRTRIERRDQSTAKATLVRTSSDTMSHIALSPDGRRLAYVTFPSCAAATPPSCSGTCNGPARFLPNVLGVLNLATGAVVKSATDNPGSPISGVSWSSDGSKLVVDFLDDPPRVLVVDPAKPRISSAPQIQAPKGCVYTAAVWIRSGIVVARTCPTGDNASLAPLLDPDALVRVSSTGRVEGSWPLPGCIDGVSAVADPTYTTALVQVDVGYGNGTCSVSWYREFLRLDGTQLATVLSAPQPVGGGTSWDLAGS